MLNFIFVLQQKTQKGTTWVMTVSVISTLSFLKELKPETIATTWSEVSTMPVGVLVGSVPLHLFIWLMFHKTLHYPINTLGIVQLSNIPCPVAFFPGNLNSLSSVIRFFLDDNLDCKQQKRSSHFKEILLDSQREGHINISLE